MRLFILTLALCLALPAQAELQYRLQPRQIAEDVWLLEGSTDNFDPRNGGNIVNTGFIVTSAGVVVIDSGPSRRYGEAMRAAIAEVTDSPVIKVLLTHHHPDHVLGNQAFTGVPIAALAGTTELLREQGDAMAENMYRMVGDWMRGTEVVLPNETLHGPLSRDSAPFEQMRDYLGWLDGLLRDAAASGADMNEVIQSPIPERFSGISLTRYELIRSVSHLYPKYEAGQLQRVDE